MTEGWLLLVLLFGNGTHTAPVGMVPFQTEALCEAAREKLADDVVVKRRLGNSATLMCVQVRT